MSFSGHQGPAGSGHLSADHEPCKMEADGLLTSHLPPPVHVHLAEGAGGLVASYETLLIPLDLPTWSLIALSSLSVFVMLMVPIGLSYSKVGGKQVATMFLFSQKWFVL